MTSLIPHPHNNSACFEKLHNSKMAIDNIKNFEVKAPYYLAEPQASPNTLILEIIFPDSSGTSSIGSKDIQENNEDEDAVDSDDSEEDDESCEEDDSEEEGDDEDVDDDEDDDEEDDESEEEEDDNGEDEDEYEDDEDFGYSFDSDELTVDFSNDDNLVVEFEDLSFEDTPPASPSIIRKTPSPISRIIPFWFTHEEQDQIHTIIEMYSTFLNIEEKRKQCIRSPAPFVGRIIRTPLKLAQNEKDKRFKTLDKVEVYLKELYPLGIMLPLSYVTWVLTTWDEDEGVPVDFAELNKTSKKSWRKLAFQDQTSTLYCAPIIRTKDNFKYSVSPSTLSSPSPCNSILSPLMYSSPSATNTSISRISPFLPEHCRVISFSMD